MMASLEHATTPPCNPIAAVLAHSLPPLASIARCSPPPLLHHPPPPSIPRQHSPPASHSHALRSFPAHGSPRAPPNSRAAQEELQRPPLLTCALRLPPLRCTITDEVANAILVLMGWLHFARARAVYGLMRPLPAAASQTQRSRQRWFAAARALRFARGSSIRPQPPHMAMLGLISQSHAYAKRFAQTLDLSARRPIGVELDSALTNRLAMSDDVQRRLADDEAGFPAHILAFWRAAALRGLERQTALERERQRQHRHPALQRAKTGTAFAHELASGLVASVIGSADSMISHTLAAVSSGMQQFHQLNPINFVLGGAEEDQLRSWVDVDAVGEESGAGAGVGVGTASAEGSRTMRAAAAEATATVDLPMHADLSVLVECITLHLVCTHRSVLTRLQTVNEVMPQAPSPVAGALTLRGVACRCSLRKEANALHLVLGDLAVHLGDGVIGDQGHPNLLNGECGGVAHTADGRERSADEATGARCGVDRQGESALLRVAGQQDLAWTLIDDPMQFEAQLARAETAILAAEVHSDAAMCDDAGADGRYAASLHSPAHGRVHRPTGADGSHSVKQPDASARTRHRSSMRRVATASVVIAGAMKRATVSVPAQAVKAATLHRSRWRLGHGASSASVGEWHQSGTSARASTRYAGLHTADDTELSMERGSMPPLECGEASSSEVYLACEDSTALSDEEEDARRSGASETSEPSEIVPAPSEPSAPKVMEGKQAAAEAAAVHVGAVSAEWAHRDGPLRAAGTVADDTFLPPMAAATDDVADPDDGSQLGGRQGTPARAPAERSMQAGSLAESAALSELPPEWHVCFDAKHRLPYYFNTRTSVSQWTRPAAGEALISTHGQAAAAQATSPPAATARDRADKAGLPAMHMNADWDAERADVRLGVRRVVVQSSRAMWEGWAPFFARLEDSFQRLPHESTAMRELRKALHASLDAELRMPWWKVEGALTAIFGAVGSFLDERLLSPSLTLRAEVGGLDAHLREVVVPLPRGGSAHPPTCAAPEELVRIRLPRLRLHRDAATEPESADRDGSAASGLRLRLLGEIRVTAPATTAGLTERILATGASAHADPAPMLASLLAERTQQQVEIDNLRHQLAAQGLRLVELQHAAQREALDEVRRMRAHALRTHHRQVWGHRDAQCSTDVRGLLDAVADGSLDYAEGDEGASRRRRSSILGGSVLDSFLDPIRGLFGERRSERISAWASDWGNRARASGRDMAPVSAPLCQRPQNTGDVCQRPSIADVIRTREPSPRARLEAGNPSCCGQAVGALRHVLLRYPVLPRLKTPGELIDAPLHRVDTVSGGLAGSRETTARALCMSRGAIVLAVRRAGCSLCREQALDLSVLLGDLEGEQALDGVRVIAVIKSAPSTSDERRALSDFATQYFGGRDVYVDPTLAFFRALGRHGRARRLSLAGAVWASTSKRMRTTPMGRRLHARQIANDEPFDMREAPLVQGGVLILAHATLTTPPRTVYGYAERTGRPLPVDEVRSAIKVMPRPIVWPPISAARN